MLTESINSKVERRLLAGELGPYDVADYMELPEDGPRYQLMRGWLVREPAPGEKHQTVVGNLYVLLRRWVGARCLGRLYVAPFDTVLSPSDVVQPDLLFVSRDQLGQPNPKNLRGRPDLVVEVLSPSTRQRDLQVKVQLYRDAGVFEAWLVDLETESVQVLQLQDVDHGEQSYAGDELVTSAVFGTLDFRVHKLFEYVV